jgi:hypothetical protein
LGRELALSGWAEMTMYTVKYSDFILIFPEAEFNAF